MHNFISMVHHPVLVNEVIDALSSKGRKIFVDCTLGLGGYTAALFEKAKGVLKVIAFELDVVNLDFAKKRLAKDDGKIIYLHKNFSELKAALEEINIEKVDGIMIDLGLSSPQVDEGERGFSFLREGPLDMRFDKTQELTAEYVIHHYSEKKLADIFKNYGEERYARKIAAEIVKARGKQSFKTTIDLADFIKSIIHSKENIHPATKVFQALRIEVNHELDSLFKVLQQVVEVLAPGGRVAVVSYHSLEDRMVKMFFKEQSKEFINLPNELKTTVLEPHLKIITKKPLVPSTEELKANPRARSAKLRVAEKI